MKIKSILFIALSAVVGFSSCGKLSKNASLKNDVDTLSYALGALNAQGLNSYLDGQLQIDTTKYLDEFLKGVNAGLQKPSDKEKAYREGLKVGEQIAAGFPNFESYFFGDDTTKKVQKEAFIAAFVAAAQNDSSALKITAAQADSLLKAIQAQKKEAQYGKGKAEGAAFLEANKAKEGVQTTASGLQYKIVKAGKGAKPTATDKVKVHYRGTLLDGTEFDSSFKRNEPAEFEVGGVIRGWSEALQLMPVGSKWELYIPYELAYGEQGAGQQIPPYATLIFEVELLSIEK